MVMMINEMIVHDDVSMNDDDKCCEVMDNDGDEWCKIVRMS